MRWAFWVLAEVRRTESNQFSRWWTEGVIYWQSLSWGQRFILVVTSVLHDPTVCDEGEG